MKKREVSPVSGKQSRCAGDAVIGGSDTPDTPPENVRYQAEPSIHAACTLDTPDTCKTINIQADAANDPPDDDPITVADDPKRLFRKRGPWLTEQQATDAKAYHLHHFQCHQCKAAGRGEQYGDRCTVGQALWDRYTANETNERKSS